MKKKMIMFLMVLVTLFSFPTQIGLVQAEKRLNVSIQPPALLVCVNQKVIITITDIDNNRVENATIFINSEEVDGGNGIVTKWIHPTEGEVAAGIKVRVEKEGFTPVEGTIKVFKKKCEDYDSIIEAGALILQLIALAKTGGGKVFFDPSNTSILSWTGSIRLPSGEIVSETAISIEGEIYAKAIGPEQTYISANFTQLKVIFEPSHWDGRYTGITTAVLDTTYPSEGFMNTTSGEMRMSFRTLMINDILTTPAIELGWFIGYFNETTGLLTMHGSSGLIYWPTGVGGIWLPVDKLGLLAPYIGTASMILVATVATAIYVKRVKRRKEKQ